MTECYTTKLHLCQTITHPFKKEVFFCATAAIDEEVEEGRAAIQGRDREYIMNWNWRWRSIVMWASTMIQATRRTKFARTLKML